MKQPYIQPILITNSTIQYMLGGMSRTTFWRRRKQWEQEGRPFPLPVSGINPMKCRAEYRYKDVMEFFKQIGIIDEY